MPDILPEKSPAIIIVKWLKIMKEKALLASILRKLAIFFLRKRYFAESSEISCQSLRAFAFESHPACYTHGPSFCELSPDKIAKIGLTIGLDSLLTAESYQQVRSTALICTQQLDDRIAASSSPRVRFELRHYQKLWQLIADDPLQINLLLSGN